MVDSGGPAVGSQAPSFTAPLAFPDGSVSEASLSSLRSDGGVLLVFQPADFDLESFAERATHKLEPYRSDLENKSALPDLNGGQVDLQSTALPV